MTIISKLGLTKKKEEMLVALVEDGKMKRLFILQREWHAVANGG